MDDEPGYWAVLRHADVVHVAKHSEIFSATEGGVVVENLDPVALETMRDMLLAMDPPRHTAYRKPVAPEFKARVIAELDGRVREVVADLRPRRPIRARRRVRSRCCAHLPSQILGEIMGLPAEDWPAIQPMAERNSGSQDPDVSDGQERGSASIEMAMYAMQFAAGRRASGPQGDLTDVLLGEEFDGHLMTDVDFARFRPARHRGQRHHPHDALVGTLALLDHPDQLAASSRPKRNPRAVEEILRWANPLHYFRRTAMVDTELGGRSRRRQGRDDLYRRQPRPCRVRGSSPVRHDPRSESTPVVRDCDTLLPRRASRPTRRTSVLRGNAASLAVDRTNRRTHPATVESQQLPQIPPGPPLMTTPPGWYHAQGDPEGTIRYWDGAECARPDPGTAGLAGSPPPEQRPVRLRDGPGVRSIIDGLIAVVVVIPFMIDYLRDIVDDVDAGGDGSGVPIPGQLLVIGIAMSVLSLLMRVPRRHAGQIDARPPDHPRRRCLHTTGAGQGIAPEHSGFLAALPVIGQVIAILVPIAALIMVINDRPERRSIYDRIAGTRVVRKASLPTDDAQSRGCFCFFRMRPVHQRRARSCESGRWRE